MVPGGVEGVDGYRVEEGSVSWLLLLERLAHGGKTGFGRDDGPWPRVLEDPGDFIAGERGRDEGGG